MRICIKIGTSSLTLPDGSVNQKYILNLSEQISKLRSKKNEILVVSSGAIGAGLQCLKLKIKPKSLNAKQALAAIGQPLVINAYSKNFAKYSMAVAQILLTRDDFEKRQSYINLRNTLNYLISNGVVPIVNENDTVAVDEIKFGDNDTLAALVSSAVNADKLIIFTDVDGFYAGHPSKASLIKVIDEITDEIESFAGSDSTSEKGTGGMKTKIAAAKIASGSAIETIIANSSKVQFLEEIMEGKIGTVIKASQNRIRAKKSWIAFSKKPKGFVFVDAKAAKIICERGKSLLSAGVVKISGNFKRGDTINIRVLNSSKDFARGLTNYDNESLEKIKGKNTAAVNKIFPTSDDEIVNRDNLVLL
ncbi:MAG: glutamate 5-kinase [Elusimicrobiota bacterium]|jgi:glutamate 5-kinase|nr:glutamate 5-kinase [Elusimicrobiota bacterium]